jgi:hypothetical protein
MITIREIIMLDAGVDPRGLDGHPGRLAAVGVELRHDLGGVPAADGGDLRVRAVHDDADRRGLAAGEPVLGALGDHQGDLDRPAVEQGSQVVLRPRGLGDGEVARPGERGLELARGHRAVEVDDRRGEVADVHGDHVAEQDQLGDRHHQQQPDQQGVTPELGELLPDQQPDPLAAHRDDLRP